MLQTLKEIPAVLFDQLEGLTIGQALEKGLISRIGDDNGNIIVEDIDNNSNTNFRPLYKTYYAIIEGFKIQCSQKLIETQVYKRTVNDLLFYSFNENGIRRVRLCHPRYLNLGRSIINIRDLFGNTLQNDAET